MSNTLLQVEDRIRAMLRDVNPDLPAVVSSQLRPLISARVQTMPGVEFGEAWTDSFLALVAGTEDYTLSALTLTNIRVLRLHSSKVELERVSMERMTGYKQGTSVSSGDPTCYAVWEDTTPNVKIRLFPTPWQTDALDKFGAVIPTEVVNDADVIPFPTDMLRALEYMVAVTALGTLTPEKAQALGVSPTTSGTFAEMGREALYWAKVRRNRMQRMGEVGVSG